MNRCCCRYPLVTHRPLSLNDPKHADDYLTDDDEDDGKTGGSSSNTSRTGSATGSSLAENRFGKAGGSNSYSSSLSASQRGAAAAAAAADAAGGIAAKGPPVAPVCDYVVDKILGRKIFSAEVSELVNGGFGLWLWFRAVGG